jgi:GH25 family lysozyme M1 (1,4-beta-N-acetylmuramidase)
MTQVEAPLSGTVITHVLVNLRQGAPNTGAPVLRKLPAGQQIAVYASTTGESVQGNSLWYRTDNGAYVWSGACSEVTAAAPPSVAPPVAPSTGGVDLSTIPLVVDISHGDGLVSFAQAKTAGVAGIIHKATTGASGKTDFYDDRRTLALAAGLLWGAYHWGTNADVNLQIDNFLGYAFPDGKADNTTLMALDFETTVGNQMTLDQCRAFCQGILGETGRKVVIYSGSVMKEALGDTVDPFFGSHRLWLAEYGPVPKVQQSWDTYWLWQYTDGITNIGPGVCTRVPGLPGDSYGHLDCDHFDRGLAALTNEWAT